MVKHLSSESNQLALNDRLPGNDATEFSQASEQGYSAHHSENCYSIFLAKRYYFSPRHKNGQLNGN